MTITYRILAEVQLIHDYYLPHAIPNPPNLPNVIPETPYLPHAKLNDPIPVDYNILDDIEILVPSECAKSLNDNKMLFRTSRTGFQILIQAKKNGANWEPVININPKTKWSFYLRLKNSNWCNFSNLRLQKFSPYSEASSMVYYFSNLSGHDRSNQLYLSREVPAFSSLYLHDTHYQLGDLIVGDNGILEAIQNGIDPGIAFNQSQWAPVNAQEINYVNPNDRIAAQSAHFTYTRPNTQTGETILFSLKDIDNNSIALGNIPGTTVPQESYITSTQSTDPVHHTLTFQGLPLGVYTLEITAPSTPLEPPRDFYLMDAFQYRNIFGVVELFAKQSSVEYDLFDFSNPVQTVIKEKTYQIRFKNRMTQWEYQKKDKSVLITTGYRPLSKHYSRFVPGDKPLPDPGVARIIPELSAPNSISKIKSIIYLNE